MHSTMMKSGDLSFKVAIITDLGQRQKSEWNAENITDLPKTLQMPFLLFFII